MSLDTWENNNNSLPNYNLDNLPLGFTREKIWTINNTSAEPGSEQSKKIRYLVDGDSCKKTYGESQVYKTWDIELGRFVALKVKVPKLPTDTVMTTPKEEGVMHAKLEHPNIPKIHNIFTAPYPLSATETVDREMLTMEWIEGNSGKNIIEQYGTRGTGFSPKELIQIAQDIGNALDYCHEQRIIHRDMKMHDILVQQSDNKALLTDFGLAVMGDEKLEYIDHNSEGFSIGVAGFKDLDTLNNVDTVYSALGDTFAYGAIMYQFVSSYNPFNPDGHQDLWDVNLAVILDNPSKISDNRSLVDQLGETTCVELDKVFAKVLAKQRPDRYQTAGAFIADFTKAFVGCKNINKKLEYASK